MDNIKLETPFENILAGNILLVVCCIFYLAWWLLSFKPVGAIKGIKSGWLLIPAFVAGIAALILLIQGIMNTSAKTVLFQGKWIILGGIAVYILYYNLNKTVGYVDGMVPLIMVGSIMFFISIKMILKH